MAPAARSNGRGPAAAVVLLATLRTSVGVHVKGLAADRSSPEKPLPPQRRIRAWFDIVESKVPSVDYSRIPDCSAEDVAYINVVVHIQNGAWSIHCGSMAGSGRGQPLADVLDKLAPQLPNVDVYVPFGLHDGVQKGGMPGREEQHVPVFGAAYHKVYSPMALPFAMGNVRSGEAARGPAGYVNTPVIGWDKFVKQWFSCNTTTASIHKAVFRGKAAEYKAQKYGACTNACSWRDNGRLLVHHLGLEKPLLVDAAATNPEQFINISMPESYHQRAPPPPIPLPEQLCNYRAILNIGNNMDWAERLRSSFYGNAIIMQPEDAGHEFFNSFMEPYVHYWPLKADLSDIKHQVKLVMKLNNVTLQLQGQRAFADKFLTEDFMMRWNHEAITEYDRRVKMFKAGSWTAPGEVERQKAKELLKLNGCEEMVRRECPAPEPGAGKSAARIA